MKSNKIKTYKLNNRIIAFYLIESQEQYIKPDELPNKFVKILMRKHNARYFEIKKWIRNNYVLIYKYYLLFDNKYFHNNLLSV
jgi:hypothetical protein